MLINLILLLLLLATVADCRRLNDIYWNSSNPIFDISNTDHVMSVKLLDRVTIVCPQPRTRPRIPYEYAKLYAVSKEGYENCELSDERFIGGCQTPERDSSISIVFRDFSPLPGAVEFKPGHSYHIITTSDGTEDGINRRSGGLCMSEHMKIKFEVQSDRTDGVSDYAEPSSAHFRHRLQNSAEVSTPLLYIIHTSDTSAEGYSASEDVDLAGTVLLNVWLIVAVCLLQIV